MAREKKTLVFGASLNPSRYSNLAITRLVMNGIETVGFGLRAGEVAGIPVKTSLDGLNGFHTITLYMNPGRQQEFYDDLLSQSPQRVIFNPGTKNPELYEVLRQADIEVLVACTLVLLATGQY
jgi:predicted CoA-binding protein